jgi:hypothetical protein
MVTGLFMVSWISLADDGRFPLGYQLAGGALTIAGPMLMLLAKRSSTYNTNSKNI